MAKQPTAHVNSDGTHVHLTNPDIPDSSWWCPIEVADVYVDGRGWVHAPPPDTSLDGLFDDSTPEGDAQTGFDPAEHTVAEINTHLAEHADTAPGEVDRVLALERAGQDRKTVVDPRDQVDDRGDNDE